jgi:hypothetical protein
MNDKPHWLIVILIGTVIGAALPHLWRSITYIVRRFKGHPLVGTWHEYHWSFVNDIQKLVTGKWIIKRGYFHELIVKFTTNVGKQLEYKGYIILEKGHLIAVLKGVRHSEHLFYRFIEPVPSNVARVAGLWMSFDHNGKICSSASILSTDVLNEESAQADIGARTGLVASVPIIRIK